jgi:holo-[acyl-carrier protein] synthase
MRIIGHGVDVVEIARIERMLGEHGARFIERCFTDDERRYCESQPRRRAEHYAARFAAKEAVAKALGTGIASGVTWRGIEIAADPGGKPRVRLHGETAQAAGHLGASDWEVSLTHAAGFALASAIALGFD